MLSSNKSTQMNASQNVLLLGETGAGKSTVINMIYNYFCDGSPSDIKVAIPTKYLSVTDRKYDRKHSESNVKDTTKSQTSKCTVYTFSHPKKGRINIIDTPGLSDTNGYEQDEKNIGQILQAAEDAENLSAIAIVVNGSNSRLTINMKNVMTRLKGSVPDVLLDNVILILTNCDETTRNFDLKVFESSLTDPILTIHMQNSAFSTDPKAWTTGSLPIIEFNWKRSFLAITKMLETIDKLMVNSTSAFKEMKEHRNKIISDLSSLLNDIKTIQDVEEKLELANSSLKQFEGDVEKYKNYIQQNTISTFKKVPTNYHNTVCMNCVSKGIVCHEHCGLQESPSTNASLFSGCACMGGGSTCRVCECGSGSHYHAREKYEKTTQTVEKVLSDIKSKFDQSQTNVNSTKNNLQTFQKDIDLLKRALVKKESEIEASCLKLKDICSGFNFAAELESVIEGLKIGAQSLTTVNGQSEAKKRIKRFEMLVDKLSGLASNRKTTKPKRSTIVEQSFEEFNFKTKKENKEMKNRDEKKTRKYQHDSEKPRNLSSFQPNPSKSENSRKYQHDSEKPRAKPSSFQSNPSRFENNSRAQPFNQKQSNFNAPANTNPKGQKNSPVPVPIPKPQIITISDPKKTTCQFFIGSGCDKGDNCNFFHPTEVCKNWSRNRECKHGNFCHFLHQ